MLGVQRVSGPRTVATDPFYPPTLNPHFEGCLNSPIDNNCALFTAMADRTEVQIVKDDSNGKKYRKGRFLGKVRVTISFLEIGVSLCTKALGPKRL